MIERTQFVKNCLRKEIVFSDLDDAGLSSIVSLAVEATIPPGAVLYRQGDPSAGFYIITSGAVRLLVGMAKDGTGGREVLTISAGNCFGAMDVLEETPRPHSAMAIDPVCLVAIDRRDFEALLASDVKVAESIIRSVEKHLATETTSSPGAMKCRPD